MNAKSIVRTAAGLALGAGALFLSPAALASSCGCADYQAPTLNGHTAQTVGNRDGGCDAYGNIEHGYGYGGGGSNGNGGWGGGHENGGDEPGTGGGRYGGGGPNGVGDWFHDHHGQVGHDPVCAPVPLPAGVWLLASGAAGLAGLTRKRKNTPV